MASQPTSTIAPAAGEAPLRGSRGQVFDLEPPRPASRSRFPEIALGMLLISGFGLGGLWWQLSTGSPTPVIALAVDVSRGEVVDLEDLQLVHLRSDDPLNVLGENDSGLVVGRVALSDMAAGTLITADDVTGGSDLEPGAGVVGLSLSAGEYPSLAMRAGDVVAVVLTPGASDASAVEGGRDAILEAAGDQVLVERAVVVEVAEVGNQGLVFTSLAMSEAEAVLVARAASLDRVRLVEVSEGSG